MSPRVRAVFAACVTAVAVRVFVAFAHPVTPRWDGFFYARLAARLTATGTYGDLATGAPTAFYPPGYPALLAFAMWLGVPETLAALVVNIAAAIVSVVAATEMSRRSSAGLAIALYPGLVLWSAATMTETVTSALLVVALALALRGRVVGAGAVIGLATLVRPVSLLAVAAVALASPQRARAFVLAAAAALCIVAPWSLRNARALDGPALVSTNLGSNLLIGSRTDAAGGYVPLATEHRCDRAVGEVARDRCFRRIAWMRIRRFPTHWIALGLRKIARTWAIEHDPAAHVFEARAPGVTALCTVAWWVLVVAAFRAGRARWRIDRLAPAVAALAGGVALAHFVFLGADRYHLVLVPSLVALAARGTS